ncbi:hypothetical protein D3C75_918370 [compost metagenome]
MLAGHICVNQRNHLRNIAFRCSFAFAGIEFRFADIVIRHHSQRFKSQLLRRSSQAAHQLKLGQITGKSARTGDNPRQRHIQVMHKREICNPAAQILIQSFILIPVGFP